MYRPLGSEHRNLSKRQAKLLKRSLQDLGYRTYGEYLVSDLFYSVKERFRASNLPQSCRVCHAPNVDLHHKTYARLGNEKLDDLIPLCRDHHDELHERGMDLWRGPKLLRGEEREAIRRRLKEGRAGLQSRRGLSSPQTA